jgi:hypothetical protein
VEREAVEKDTGVDRAVSRGRGGQGLRGGCDARRRRRCSSRYDFATHRPVTVAPDGGPTKPSEIQAQDPSVIPAVAADGRTGNAGEFEGRRWRWTGEWIGEHVEELEKSRERDGCAHQSTSFWFVRGGSYHRFDRARK